MSGIRVALIFMRKKETEKDQSIVITMRCIDMVPRTSNIDKVPCSECNEMTWISTSFRDKKVDKIICEHCFLKSGRHKDEDYHACVTEECIIEALSQLENSGLKTTRKEMVKKMEKKIGKKIIVIKQKNGKTKG